jgi:N-acetylglucosaminyldiphosphoundecaprenol N-acetyl-beta-D-mannosaminyltransferase
LSIPANSLTAPAARDILGVRVDATSYPDAADRIVRWAGQDESRYVCVCTVNNIIEAYDDRAYHKAMRRADL